MVEITILEIDIEEGSFSASLPFSSYTGAKSDEVATDGGETEDDGTEDDGDESSGGGKGRALLGVFLFFVVAAAAVRYLSAGDDEETEVEIETPDEPVGVTVDTDDED